MTVKEPGSSFWPQRCALQGASADGKPDKSKRCILSGLPSAGGKEGLFAWLHGKMGLPGYSVPPAWPLPNACPRDFQVGDRPGRPEGAVSFLPDWGKCLEAHLGGFSGNLPEGDANSQQATLQRRPLVILSDSLQFLFLQKK